MINEKPKAMLTWKNGFIITKRQMMTLQDGYVWVISKNAAKVTGLETSKEIFAEHGYDVIDWDDDQEASDGQIGFTRTENDDGK